MLDQNIRLEKEYQQMMNWHSLYLPSEKPKLPMNSRPLMNMDAQTSFRSSN
jgi:hypothetical protein